MKLPGPLPHPGPLSHPSHPEHKLKWKHTTNTFKCNGCKEPGIGCKYKCDECNFNLHDKCALPTPGPLSHPEPLSHPSHPKHKLKWKYTRNQFMCNGCKEPGIDYKYKCDECNFNLHHKCALSTPGTLSHPSHPKHELKWKDTTNPFMCNGCKEHGIGYKYKCDECNFNLHKKCALPTLTVVHEFFKKCEFRFDDRPPRSDMKCDACNKVVRGFGFGCRKKHCDYVLHPCCENLPRVLHDGNLDLHLHPENLSEPCNECQKKGPGWSYRSDCRKHNLHVACAKKLLMEAWDAVHQNKDEKKVRGKQVMIPKRVVTPKNHHHVKGKEGGGGGGKIPKYVRFLAVAAGAVVSALLGDPTAIIAVVANYILPYSMKRLGN